MTTRLAPPPPVRTQDGSHTHGLITGGLCLLSMLALYLVAVRTPQGQALDSATMNATASLLAEAEWTGTVLNLVSPVSLVLSTLAVAAVGLAAHGVGTAVRAIGVVMITAAGAQLLKVSLTRPEWFDTLGNSWPSGHVAAVAGLAVAATLAVPLVIRPATGLTGGVLVMATAVATMAQGWHRPSDAIAAALLAVAVGCLSGLRPTSVVARLSTGVGRGRPGRHARCVAVHSVATE